MAINGVTNTPAHQAVTTGKKQPSATDYQDMLKRIGDIPDLEQYEGAIKRMLSGESEMEHPDKPLTEDQILMRKLKREYEKTNPLSAAEQGLVMQRERRAAREHWKSIGGSGPMPGSLILPDGTIKLFYSKEEKYDYQKMYDESFLRKVLSVIEERKAERDEKAEKAEAAEEKAGKSAEATKDITQDDPSAWLATQAELKNRSEMRTLVDSFDKSSIAGQHINPDEIERQEELSKRYSAIQSKVRSGQKLTDNEKSFLKENYPELYAKAMQNEQEAQQFRNQLDRAGSKEEAAKLYLEKKMQLLAQGAKDGSTISTAAAIDAEYRGFGGGFDISI